MSDKIERLLAEHGVVSTAEHANITSRCIGVCCPWCGDGNFHLGIFRDAGNFTCWRCGRSGPLWRLTQELFGMGRREVERVLGQEVDWDEKPALERIHEIIAGKSEQPVAQQPEPMPVDLPPSRPIQHDWLPKPVAQFLTRRRFTVDDCIRYEARYAGAAAGVWEGHLILPVRMDGILVGYLGRQVGPGEPRYRNLPGIQVKSLGALYGADHWKGGRLILVEGPLDVWRLGDQACATFGTSLTSAQRDRLWAMNPDELVVAWDADAYRQALALGRDLAVWARHVRVARLPSGHDPDTLGMAGLERLLA